MKNNAANARKIKFINTPVQNKTLLLVFASAVIPMAVVVMCLYYLIFNMLAWQMGIPEMVAYNLIPVVRKVNMILLVLLPVVLIVIWFVALELSHRIAGPIYRLEKELDSMISGKSQGPIKLRPRDELKALADKINRLVGRAK
ncbi:MAG: HAMP domain-containing protein [Bacteroidia bacterium]|nr:HAMP domain-containing protein [Bacteroidia bacterium]